MSLNRQLARWQEAGLIDAAVAARIAAHEASRRRPVALYAISGLGALAIAIGITSLIAANWDGIGRPIKLGIDLLLLLGLGFGAWRCRAGSVAREVFLILYFLSTLASIALIGQAYQLGGEVYQGLALWLLVASPMVLFGRRWLLAALWLAGLIATIVACAAEAFDNLQLVHDETIQLGIGIAAVALGPVLCFALGTPRSIRERRPEYAALFRVVGWIWLVVLTSVAQHAWYDDIDRNQHILYHAGLAVAAAAGLFLAWLLPTTLPQATLRARLTLGGAVAFAAISSVLPGAFPRDDVPVLGVISFIALWVGFASAAYQLGRIWLLNIATAIIAIRLVVAYVELLGSMLETGVSMIVGGLLTLLLAWLWVKKSREFRNEQRSRMEGHP
jgi:uncharacterized membrane protein